MDPNIWKSLAILAGIILVGILGNILTGWLDKPNWATSRLICILLLALTLIAAYLGWVKERLDERQSTINRPSGQSPEVDLADRAKGRLLLINDDSAGYPILFATQLDGSNKQRMWAVGSDLKPAFTPGSTDFVIPQYDEATETTRLELRTVDGDLIRGITQSGRDYEDQFVAIARETRDVFFVRAHIKPIDEQTSTYDHYELLKTNLDTPSQVVKIELPYTMTEVAVDDSGQVIAGSCSNPGGGPDQICVSRLDTGENFVVPGSEQSGMEDAAVSPDGRLVAYSSIKTNPYGTSQVYVYDIERQETLQISQLIGWNSQAAWSPDADDPCLVFTHNETVGSTIYLACLMPELSVLPTNISGEYPVWFE